MHAQMKLNKRTPKKKKKTSIESFTGKHLCRSVFFNKAAG